MAQLYIFGIAVIINIISFIAMALDKYFAVKGKWRISESTLLLFSVFGGSLGSLIGMVTCRHKINKPKFRFGVPVIILIQVSVAAWLIYSGIVELSILLI